MGNLLVWGVEVWEYRRVSSDEAAWAEKITMLGTEGWEMVAAYPVTLGKFTFPSASENIMEIVEIFWFKREVDVIGKYVKKLKK